METQTSLSAAARELGYSREHISAVVNGRSVPGAQLAIDLERILGIPREELRPDLWGIPLTLPEDAA